MDTIKEDILKDIAENGPLRDLQLESVWIDAFPDELWQQPLEYVSLSEVSLADGTLPVELFNLPSLRNLELYDVSMNASSLEDDEETLSQLPEQINLPALSDLCLSDNDFRSLPNLAGMPQLRVLDLSHNIHLDFEQLSLPKGISHLALTRMALNPEHMPALEQLFASLPQLQKLYINNNELEFLPQSCASLAQLAFIDVSYNPLEQFPGHLVACGQLEEINACSCSLNDRTLKFALDEGHCFDALRLLHLDHNELQCLPPIWHYFPKLTHLRLNENSIDHFPENFCSLQALHHLSLKSNAIALLPEFMSDFTTLRSLDISHNKFQDFPKCLYRMEHLEVLVAMGNHFYQIFSGIKQMKNLRTLDLCRSYILFMAKELAELTQLQSLILSYNPMKKIPDLSKMQELTHLELSGLVELECFEIHENEEDFEQLSALSSLKDLSVQNTPVIEALFGLKECLALNRINVGFRGMDRERALALREHLDPVIVWIQPQRH